jgi:hypothetical protein
LGIATQEFDKNDLGMNVQDVLQELEKIFQLNNENKTHKK